MTNKDYLRCIALCRDCAELCLLCVKLDLRASENRHHMMKICIENCLACAAECERFPHSDIHAESAKACLACAKEMQKMIN